MRTVLEQVNGKHVVEVPHVIVGLYSLKNGQVFEIRAREKKDILIINMATMLTNNSQK